MVSTGTPFAEEDSCALPRQLQRLFAYSAMHSTFAGMNPNCAVLAPMMHTTTLFAPAITQPCHRLFPMSTVAKTVSMQER